MSMNTKSVLLLIGAAFVFYVCGCNTNEIEAGAETTISENAEYQETLLRGEMQHKGYVFHYHDIAIEIDTEATPVIEKLGEPDFYYEAASCAFDGKDKMYLYSSFEIDTYPMNDTDYISSVIFKDDSILTAEGIGIGDSEDKLTEVYGEAGEDRNGMLVFEKDKIELCFIIKDGRVASIEYRSTVLEE